MPANFSKSWRCWRSWTGQSQFDTLDTARKGLQKVKGILQSAQELVDMFPEDKTAQRALKDADVMLRRFQRHEEAARAMIKKLSKKAMPPDLVKAASSLTTAVKRMLINPKALRVVPWQREVTNYRTNVTGVEYQMVFILPTPERARNNEHQFYLIQRTIDREGVKYGRDRLNLHGAKPYSLKEAKEAFFAGLEGWSGIKGLENVVSQRAKVVPDIKNVLWNTARRLGDMSRERGVEVSKDNRELSVTFRTDVDSRDYGQYDESYTDYALANYAPKFEAALKPYAKHIKNQSVSNEGYKGYWTYYVTLR